MVASTGSAETSDVLDYLGDCVGGVAASHLPLLGIEDNAVGFRQPDSDNLKGSASLQQVDDAGVARRKGGGTNDRHDSARFVSLTEKQLRRRVRRSTRDWKTPTPLPRAVAHLERPGPRPVRLMNENQ